MRPIFRGGNSKWLRKLQVEGMDKKNVWHQLRDVYKLILKESLKNREIQLTGQCENILFSPHFMSGVPGPAVQTSELLLWLTIWRTGFELCQQFTNIPEWKLKHLFNVLKHYLHSSDRYVVYETQRLYVAVLKKKEIKFVTEEIATELTAASFETLGSMCTYTEICRDLLSRHNPLASSFFDQITQPLLNLLPILLQNRASSNFMSCLYQLILTHIKIVKLILLYQHENASKFIFKLVDIQGTRLVDLLFECTIQNGIVWRKLCQFWFKVLSLIDIKSFKSRTGILKRSALYIVEKLIKFGISMLYPDDVKLGERRLTKFGFTGSEELSEEDNSPDCVRLGEGCLLCLKACECLSIKLKNREKVKKDTEKSLEVLYHLDKFIKENIPSNNIVPFHWLPQIFGDQDDSWIEALLLLLNIAPVEKSSEVKSKICFNHHLYFCQFVSSTAYDHGILVDLLTSPETSFLAYFTKYLKYCLRTWDDFIETLRSDIDTHKREELPKEEQEVGQNELHEEESGADHIEQSAVKTQEISDHTERKHMKEDNNILQILDGCEIVEMKEEFKDASSETITIEEIDPVSELSQVVECNKTQTLARNKSCGSKLLHTQQDDRNEHCNVKADVSTELNNASNLSSSKIDVIEPLAKRCKKSSGCVNKDYTSKEIQAKLRDKTSDCDRFALCIQNDCLDTKRQLSSDLTGVYPMETETSSSSTFSNELENVDDELVSVEFVEERKTNDTIRIENEFNNDESVLVTEGEGVNSFGGRKIHFEIGRIGKSSKSNDVKSEHMEQNLSSCNGLKDGEITCNMKSDKSNSELCSKMEPSTHETKDQLQQKFEETEYNELYTELENVEYLEEKPMVMHQVMYEIDDAESFIELDKRDSIKLVKTPGLTLLMSLNSDSESEECKDECRSLSDPEVGNLGRNTTLESGVVDFILSDEDEEAIKKLSEIGSESETFHEMKELYNVQIPENLDKMMSVLIRVRIKLEKLRASGILQYNPEPLLKLLRALEEQYESVT